MPVIHWKGWQETYYRWHEEGLPREANEHRFFGTVPYWTTVGVGLGLRPAFEPKVLEDAAEYRIVQDDCGVIKKDWKYKSCIPHHFDWAFKTAADWPEFKRRLQPDPGRSPEDIDERIRRAEESGLPIALSTASLMGWLRNWMGVENFCYLMYDSPETFADVVQTIADLVCWGIDHVMPKMNTIPDLGFGWEDICGKSGPLVSPEIFRKHVAPGYRKIRAKLDAYGIPLYGIDTDGFIEPLLKDWLEAGVNLQFPVEIGTWQADPHALRKKYGKDLRIVGGYNKLALEKGRAAIDAELERRVPLMKEGGFVVMPDHLITPGVALSDYQYYLGRVRALRL
ncbi:MAG: hypothetical protein JXR37_11580 [Kiritimatiellae bacterium]|nr:hypothetical protein [Kiritimatiellia bacterium]